jgi:hypothetical protein
MSRVGAVPCPDLEDSHFVPIDFVRCDTIPSHTPSGEENPMRSTPILLFLAVVLITGCEDPKPGEVVTFDTVCSDKYAPDEANPTFTRVTLEGYLAPPAMFTMCSHGSCSMDLKPTPDADKRMSIDLKSGGGKNHMETLPDKFSADDIKVTTHDGKTVGVGGKIRVTGKRLGKGESCSIYKVDLIESAE